ncbi:hypothetical protein PLEOSDRAFT_167095 [Pleurotus ostreatus PC15]|uniref:Tafazzin family protein n=1 Tax=Pleurotus ostreatus (strain PC15) TaxID=1137138 RepID=A0A067NZH0_PLEO1|nr:hypothetical protein PLEOSDRAFT_167095 [Pleurotus ostreatus PC15]
MGLLSTATIATIGLGSKALLHAPGSCSLTVNGLDILTKALDSGRSVITVANHISTVDDPVAWGILPTRYYLRPRTMRWALGASDIMFTNPVFSKFFRLGQVHETFRGKGIYQPAVDAAIDTLNTTGGWIHLFGEGKVNQPSTYPIDPVTRKVHLPRFKWGVGRILMESTPTSNNTTSNPNPYPNPNPNNTAPPPPRPPPPPPPPPPRPPLIIPMWLSGFDALMPEGRAAPWKYAPRFFAAPRVRVGVAFGEAVEGAEVVRAAWRAVGGGRGVGGVIGDVGGGGGVGGDVGRGAGEGRGEGEGVGWVVGDVDEEAVARVRSEITAAVQKAVEDLGRTVDGAMLGRVVSDSTEPDN